MLLSRGTRVVDGAPTRMEDEDVVDAAVAPRSTDELRDGGLLAAPQVEEEVEVEEASMGAAGRGKVAGGVNGGGSGEVYVRGNVL